MKKSTIGVRVKDARISYGLSQVNLCKEIGITQQALSLIENEKITPTVKSLNSISKALNVTLGWLLGDSADTKNKFVKIRLINEYKKELIMLDCPPSVNEMFILVEKKYEDCFSTIVKESVKELNFDKGSVIVIDPHKTIDEDSIIAISKNGNIGFLKNSAIVDIKKHDAEIIGVAVLKVTSELI